MSTSKRLAGERGWRMALVGGNLGMLQRNDQKRRRTWHVITLRTRGKSCARHGASAYEVNELAKRGRLPHESAFTLSSDKRRGWVAQRSLSEKTDRSLSARLIGKYDSGAEVGGIDASVQEVLPPLKSVGSRSSENRKPKQGTSLTPKNIGRCSKSACAEVSIIR